MEHFYRHQVPFLAIVIIGYLSMPLGYTKMTHDHIVRLNNSQVTSLDVAGLIRFQRLDGLRMCLTVTNLDRTTHTQVIADPYPEAGSHSELGHTPKKDSPYQTLKQIAKIYRSDVLVLVIFV